MDEADHTYQGHAFADGQDAEVEGHSRTAHIPDEDKRPSSPAEAVDLGLEDDGPDVEGHGHLYHGRSGS